METTPTTTKGLNTKIPKGGGIVDDEDLSSSSSPPPPSMDGIIPSKDGDCYPSKDGDWSPSMDGIISTEMIQSITKHYQCMDTKSVVNKTTMEDNAVNRYIDTILYGQKKKDKRSLPVFQQILRREGEFKNTD